MKPEIITKGEYARQRNVKPHAVSMWIARGHLTSPALRDDGTINVELADEQLRERLDVLKSTGKGTGPQTLFAVASGPAKSAPTAAAPEEAALGPLNELRVRRLQLQVEEDERKVAIARGELVAAADIEAIWAQELGEWIAAVEQWIPDLVTKLGGGRAEVDIARREWRALRQRQAAASADQEADRAA